MIKIGLTKALFVDIGGVLLSNGWGHHSRKLAADTFNLNLEELNKRHKVTVGLFESGTLSMEEYLKLVVFHEKRNFTMTQFRKFIFAQTEPYPEMIELIRRLKAQYGLKIVVVSNEGHELNEYRISKFKLDRIADSFISSCFIHLRKPDPEIFRAAFDIAQVPNNRVIYIEDTPMFVEVAKGLGMKSILHKDYETTRAELASLGLAVAEG